MNSNSSLDEISSVNIRAPTSLVTVGEAYSSSFGHPSHRPEQFNPNSFSCSRSTNLTTSTQSSEVLDISNPGNSDSQLHDGANVDEPESESSTRTERIISYIAMCTSLLTFSAVGPAFKFMMFKWKVPGGVAMVWRNQAMVVWQLVPTIIEFMRTPSEERSKWWVHIPNDPPPATDSPALECLKKHQSSFDVELHPREGSSASSLSASATTNIVTDIKESSCKQEIEAPYGSWHVGYYVLGNVLAWVGYMFLWVQSLNYTTTVRAGLFANTYPLMIMAYTRWWKGERHSSGEYLGVLLSVLGVGVCLFDSNPDDWNAQSGARAIIGDLMNLVAAALTGASIMFTGHARKLLPSMLFSFIKTFGFIFFAILLSVSAGEHPKIFDGGVDGVFGWLGAEYVQQMLLFGFLVGIFGSFAWNFCLKHIDPLVFSTVELVEPVLTGVIAFAMGLEGIPKAWTLTGGVVILTGGVFVAINEAKRRREEKEKTKKSTIASESSTVSLSPPSSDFGAGTVQQEAIQSETSQQLPPGRFQPQLDSASNSMLSNSAISQPNHHGRPMSLATTYSLPDSNSFEADFAEFRTHDFSVPLSK